MRYNKGMKTNLVSLLALLSLVACVPAEMAAPAPQMAKMGGETEDLGDNDQMSEYEAPFKPVSVCRPRTITHLGKTFYLQDMCTGLGLQGATKTPTVFCPYQTGNDHHFDPIEGEAALKALLYDRYGFTPSEIEFTRRDNEPNGIYGNHIGFKILRDRTLPISQRTQFGFTLCEQGDPERDLNLDE